MAGDHDTPRSSAFQKTLEAPHTTPPLIGPVEKRGMPTLDRTRFGRSSVTLDAMSPESRERLHERAAALVQAVRALEKAVELDRQRSPLHVLLAEALLRAGEVEHARLAFFEAAYRDGSTPSRTWLLPTHSGR